MIDCLTDRRLDWLSGSTMVEVALLRRVSDDEWLIVRWVMNLGQLDNHDLDKVVHSVTLTGSTKHWSSWQLIGWATEP